MKRATKTQVSAWIDKDDYELIKKLASIEGLSMSKYVKNCIHFYHHTKLMQAETQQEQQ